MVLAVSSVSSVQAQVAATLHLACAGEPLEVPSRRLLEALSRLEGQAGRVTSNYLPILQGPLSGLAARADLLPAVRASLYLGLVTYWNALSRLPGAEPGLSLPETALMEGLKTAGLGESAGYVASSVLAQRPSETTMKVIAGRSVTALWFRQTIEASALWRRGVNAAAAPMLAQQVMHLERTSESDYSEAIETTRPFQEFADGARGARGPVPLPGALRGFLMSERFVRLALERSARKRRTLIAFLDFAALEPSKVPSANFARFPGFESFQGDEGVWRARNNFHLYFAEVRGNVHRTTSVLKRFRKEHPDLDRSLADFYRNGRWDREEAIERLLYEAYRRMASFRRVSQRSLVV